MTVSKMAAEVGMSFSNSVLRDFRSNKKLFDMLKSAYHALGRFERSVCLLKIKSCVADCDISFSNVVCRTQRHIEVSKPPDLHLFLDLFKPACDMLEEYFRNPVYEPNNRAMQLALEKLLTVLMELDGELIL